MSAPTQTPTVRPLSESEIHDRLYGSYFGKRRAPKQEAPVPVAPPPVPQKAPEPVPQQQAHPTHANSSNWTGSEILSGELKRLRSELIELRKEKDQLAARLQKAAPPQAQVQTASVEKPRFGIGRWIARTLSVIALFGIVGYFAGARVIQASPAAGDSTPYTIQVAVYNGQVMANQARGLLQELGYDAFLAEMPRIDGKIQYRVYVGSFVTKEEAAQESERLAADNRFQYFKDAFVLVR